MKLWAGELRPLLLGHLLLLFLLGLFNPFNSYPPTRYLLHHHRYAFKTGTTTTNRVLLLSSTFSTTAPYPLNTSPSTTSFTTTLQEQYQLEGAPCIKYISVRERCVLKFCCLFTTFSFDSFLWILEVSFLLTAFGATSCL